MLFSHRSTSRAGTQFKAQGPRLLGALALLLCLLGSAFFAAPALQAHADTNFTGASIGTPYSYSGATGDTWYNTWADDGNIYASSNDTLGFNGNCNSDITFGLYQDVDAFVVGS